jgi:small subunit ribosomal protein S6
LADFPREPRNYELMVMLLPELADEALTGAVDAVSGYVAQIGGETREILQDSPWGRRRLAYTIRFNGTDYRDGYYAIWHFSTKPSSLSDLERDLKLDVRVMRHLLVIEDPKWGSPQERDAVREAANAPAVAEPADEQEVTQEAEVTEAAVTAETPNEETVAVVEAVVDAEPVEATAETVEAADVVADETAVETVETAEVGDEPAAEETAVESVGAASAEATDEATAETVEAADATVADEEEN